MFTFLLYIITVAALGTVSGDHTRSIRELERRTEILRQDLLFTDYDHRVDLCHLQYPPETQRRERCVIEAYHRYCRTSGQCRNYRGEGN